MRPAHVYANPSDEHYQQLVEALHRQWRVATRAVMILLSASGMTATEIAVLLHYDPATVRRWIARHDLEGLNGLPDRPRPGRPRIASPGIGERIRRLLATPKAWTTVRIYQGLGRPAISLRTCYRRIREQGVWRRPRLIAKGDPDHDTICADIREQIAALPTGSVVLAEDETHLDLIARIQACWMPRDLRHRVLTPGTNQRRTLHGAVNMVTGAWHHHVSVYNVSGDLTRPPQLLRQVIGFVAINDGLRSTGPPRATRWRRGPRRSPRTIRHRRRCTPARLSCRR